MPDDIFASANESAGGPKDWDPDKFYTRSRNKLGHGQVVRLTVMMPPDVAGAVASLVARRVFPDYKTPADLYRDAIVHWMNFRSQQADDPEFTPIINVYTRLAEAETALNKDEAARNLIATRQKQMMMIGTPAERQSLKADCEADLPTLPEKYQMQMQMLIQNLG